MARGKKDRKVETLHHRSGAKVDIMFDPNPGGEYGLTFSARVGDKWFRDPSAAAIRQTVYRYLDEQVQMTWIPVIIVSEIAPFHPGTASFVGIEVTRAYMANGADGAVRRLNWDDYHAQEGTFIGPSEGENVDAWRLLRAQTAYMGIKSVPDGLPFVTKSSDKETRILPYTEELYTGLVEIDRGIERLREKLRDLLGDKEGWSRIAEIGSQMMKMLPAPAEDEGE